MHSWLVALLLDLETVSLNSCVAHLTCMLLEMVVVLKPALQFMRTPAKFVDRSELAKSQHRPSIGFTFYKIICTVTNWTGLGVSLRKVQVIVFPAFLVHN